VRHVRHRTERTQRRPFYRVVKTGLSAAAGRYDSAVKESTMRNAPINAVALMALFVGTLSACAPKSTLTGTNGGPPPDTGAIKLPPPPAGPNAPEAPRAYLDTHYSAPTGHTIAVAAGGDFQAALNAAQPCDVITLAAGATFTGSFTLPAKSGTCWITIRSSAPDASLPAEGARMTPSFSNVLPKIVTGTTQPALQAAAGAQYYRIMEVEITAASSVTQNYGLVTLGQGTETAIAQLPANIILDRVYIHGTSTVNVSRCVALNDAASAVIDSYLSECHAQGFDSQAICGWNGPGPFKIANDYLEGAGEIVMFGGADPTIANLTPSDIEIRHNHFTRPTSWKGVWSVKNLLEFKNARRVQIEGNVFENNWPDAQDGFAVVWKSSNETGAAPWSVTRDVIFRYNRLRNSAGGVNIAAHPGTYPVEPLSRVLISNNVFDNINTGVFTGHGRLYQTLNGPADVTIEHNTTINSDASNAAFTMDVTPPLAANFVFRDNVITRGQYGFFGSGAGEGTAALNYYMSPGYVFQRNLIVAANSGLYPADNSFPATLAAIGFVDAANGNYQLASSSRYIGTATDGKDPGADIATVNSATAGVVLP